MSKPAWIVNKPAVVSEVIDGELVVMNLATGNYFSSAGSGARLWARLDHGASAEGLVATLAAHHEVDVDTARADVERYLATLQAEGLVREYGEEEKAQSTRIDRAEKAMAIARLRYEAGHTGYLEVLDAQRSLNDAQLAAIGVRQARLSSSVGLFKALGGGWKADTPS